MIEKYDFHRINPDNILKTEASFRQDTHILMLFEESNDSMIQNFRRYGSLPHRTRTLPTIITPDTTDIARQSDEVIALKTQYAAILGQTKAYTRRIALHDTEQIALYRVISELSNSK